MTLISEHELSSKYPHGFVLSHTLIGHSSNISRIAWSPDGNYIASPSQDGTIRIWNVNNGKELVVIREHKGEVFHVAWSKDAKNLHQHHLMVKLLFGTRKIGR